MKLATLCYVRDGNRTLMIHRIKKDNDMHHGKWNGLGGKLEAGESPEECARREIFEESGLIATELKMKGILTFPKFANNEDWYAYVFVVTGYVGELIDSEEGNLEWVHNERLNELDLWEGDYIFLPWLEWPGFFSGKFTYKNGKLIEHRVIFHNP